MGWSKGDRQFFRTEKTPWEIAVGVIEVYRKEYELGEVGDKEKVYGIIIKDRVIAFGQYDKGNTIKEVYQKRGRDISPEIEKCRLNLINKIEDLTGVEIR